MSKLNACSGCSSFLPTGASACPACGAAVPATLGLKVLRGLAATGAGSLLAMTLSACYGAPIGPEYNPWCSDSASDLDRDGYCGVYDCNESDSSVNAGASDPVGDGIDQNCDGVDGTLEADGGM